MTASLSRSALRTSFSFHRLANEPVADRIVAASGLAPPDHVYEFGAGDGMLTAALLRSGAHVIAVERDPELIAALRARTHASDRLRIVQGDALELALPRSKPYKCVANPPFSITSELLHHLIFRQNPPVDASLVLQREAALHWGGFHEESVVSILAKLRFAFHLRLAMRRRDFHPHPSVDTVLLGMTRLPRPLLSPSDERVFERLVRAGFGYGRSTAMKNLRGAFPRTRWPGVASRAGVQLDLPPSSVRSEHWLRLFQAWRAGGC